MYHISPTTGNPNICRAQNGNCPFADESEHYETKADARSAFELRNSAPRTLSKKLPTRKAGSVGDANIYANTVPGVRPKRGEHCDLSYFSERDADEILDEWERPLRTNTPNFTFEEKKALRQYGGAGFTSVGRLLRDNPLKPGEVEKDELLINLASAISKSKLSSDVTLFRGVHGDYAEQLTALEPGATVKELSYSSTTPSEHNASGFTKDSGVMLQIEAKAGAQAIDYSEEVMSLDEDEILLPPQSFKVREVVREVVDGRNTVRVVLDPQ